MTPEEIIEHRKLKPKSKAKMIKDGLGESALTYIEEVLMEVELQRPLQKEQNGKPTSWGTFVESRVFDLLPLDYIYQSEQRYQHEELTQWTGAPDMLTKTKVCDIKCPYSIKEYVRKARIMINNDIEGLKNDYPENYWQLVSNSILTGKDVAELIIYCPYLSELVEIKESVQNSTGDANKVAWLNWADDNDLPFLRPEGKYKNLYKMEWTVSENDKQALYDRVKYAISLL